MSGTSMVLFLAASLVVIVAPGPDNILVLTRGVTMGRRAALVSAGGAAVGLVVHSIFAAAGLSAVLQRSSLAYSFVKYVGAAYLVYLGVRALRDRGAIAPLGVADAGGLRAVFRHAVASNVLNPKIAVFFLAYLPQFAAPGSGGVAWRLLGLGLAFALLTWAIFSGVAYASGALGGWLRRRPRAASGLGWVTGAVLVGLALRLAVPERR